MRFDLNISISNVTTEGPSTTSCVEIGLRFCFCECCKFRPHVLQTILLQITLFEKTIGTAMTTGDNRTVRSSNKCVHDININLLFSIFFRAVIILFIVIIDKRVSQTFLNRSTPVSENATGLFRNNRARELVCAQ